MTVSDICMIFGILIVCAAADIAGENKTVGVITPKSRTIDIENVRITTGVVIRDDVQTNYMSGLSTWTKSANVNILVRTQNLTENTHRHRALPDHPAYLLRVQGGAHRKKFLGTIFSFVLGLALLFFSFGCLVQFICCRVRDYRRYQAQQQRQRRFNRLNNRHDHEDGETDEDDDEAEAENEEEEEEEVDDDEDEDDGNQQRPYYEFNWGELDVLNLIYSTVALITFGAFFYD